MYKNVCIWLFVATHLCAGEIVKEMSFSVDALFFSKVNEYDVISMIGSQGMAGNIGAPGLPQINKLILLPPTANAVKIEIIKYISKEVEGEYLILPIQPPASDEKVSNFVSPDDKIYGSISPYPGKLAELIRTSSMGGYRVCPIRIYPVEYIPEKRELKLYTTIEVKITYEEGKVSAKKCTKQQVEVFQDIIKNRLLNPEDLYRWSPPLGSKQSEWEYVVITEPAFVSAFQPLVDWKTQKGVPSIIVTTDSIFANCSGSDNAEKVRNFIVDGFNNHGTIWVLLGGDPSETDVPIRDKVPTFWTDPCPTDWYFSDLDGNWNADGDNTYGEYTDNVDLYPDVFVGRATIGNATEASNFVQKVLNYEKSPPMGNYITKMLLVQSLTASNNKKELYDSIAMVTPGYFQISKLNIQDMSFTPTQVCDSINAGVHFVCFTGHGNASSWDCGSGSMSSSNASGLTNGNKTTIFHIEPCYTGNMTTNCVTEAFMNKYPGGTIGIMASLKKGIGTQGSYPGFLWWGDAYLNGFFKNLFLNNIYSLGGTVTAAKGDWTEYAYAEDTNGKAWRHCMFTYNLQGDPELPLWTNTPKTAAFAYQVINGTDSAKIVITITDSVTSNPINNALVCMRKLDQSIYKRGKTNASGDVDFYVPQSAIGDSFNFTITAHNYLPYIKSTDVPVEETELCSESKCLLLPIHPDPFNKVTKITYILARQSKVKLQVYDVTGKLVQDLVSGIQEKGCYTIEWEPKNTSSGVYFVRLATRDFATTKKVILYSQK
ncbi:MAG: T9SS type A sorting domain-containing protein [Candidatus Stahlbacteria bacterium]|nr:T9SS type A sorting domain-containing protein [Candidatus Stahlbacteria bacterium]